VRGIGRREFAHLCRVPDVRPLGESLATLFRSGHFHNVIVDRPRCQGQVPKRHLRNWEIHVPAYIDYGEPNDIWVDDGHVFVRAYNGTIVRMKPEVAILVGRKLEAFGTESFINKVMDGDAKPADYPPAR
jgi:hypothetical protein